jgi:cytochrome c
VARIIICVLLLVACAATVVGVLAGAPPASAKPSFAGDCADCHGPGSGQYRGTVTAPPSAAYPAAGAAYTVAISISENPNGAFDTGYWIANSDASGITGSSTGVYGGGKGSSTQSYTASLTAPSTEAVYYYKVFGEDGNANADGATNFAVYSITVDTTAPMTTDNRDTAKHAAFKLVFSPTDAVSGVASTQYSVDGGAWTPGTSVLLSLPRLHKRAGLSVGTHTVQYRSTDRAGNLETVKSCQVILGR